MSQLWMHYFHQSIYLIGAVILLYLHTSSIASEEQQVNKTKPCNLLEEFQCLDNQCIPKTKVCNFVQDCSNGDDEQRCGSCDFSAEAGQSCGLTLRDDRVFKWFRTSINLTENPLSSIRGYVYPSAYQGLWTVAHASTKYKPQILFPHMGPTDSDTCRLEFSIYPWSSNNNISSWPNIKFYRISSFSYNGYDAASPVIISDSLNEPRYMYLLGSFSINQNHTNSHVTSHVAINYVSTTIWTILIEVESQLTDNGFGLTNFKFMGCEPSKSLGKWSKYILNLTSTQMMADCTAERGKFLCPISGVCIDTDQFCDFSHDCGPHDDSDERLCDDYQGRCDFEDEHWCNWFPEPKPDSWLWAGSRDLREVVDNQTRPMWKPQSDHTFLMEGPQAEGGHYLLLNAPRMRENEMIQLQGPRVQLRPGAQECSFRFWLATSRSLHSARLGLEASLMVGFTRLSASQIFQNASNNALPGLSEWRRYEILLFDQHTRVGQELYSLQVSFGDLSSESLETFELASGYLALDDFSFSQGCQLGYYNSGPQSICGQNQHHCEYPTRQTNANCLHLKLVCDFKNDCGKGPMIVFDDTTNVSVSKSSDERYCATECNQLELLEHPNPFQFHGCKLQTSDLDAFGSAPPARSRLLEISPFLELTSHTEAGARFIRVKSRIDEFRAQTKNRNLIDLSKGISIEVQSWFGMRHGKCMLEFEFGWSEPPLENLEFRVFSWQFEGTNEILYKEKASTKRVKKRIQLRIGEESSQFRISFRLQLVGQLKDYLDKKRNFSGAFELYSYKFLNCAYPQGLVDASNQSQVIMTEHGSDNDYNEREDALDRHDGTIPTGSKACPLGQFQCNRPILCLDESLMCDMQRDCQLSGLDEMNCAGRGSLQYSFEQTSSKIFTNSQDWLNDPRADAVFQVLQWGHLPDYHATRRPINLPLFDHTTKKAFRNDGSFISLIHKDTKIESNDDDPRETKPSVGVVYSPRMLKSDKCKRMVLYLWEWTTNHEHLPANKPSEFYLKVLVQHSSASDQEQKKSIETLGEYSEEWPATKAKGSTIEHRMGWRRLQFDLEPSNKTGDWFTVALFGAIGAAKNKDYLIISLDDISFGPSCEIAEDQSRREFLDKLQLDARNRPVTSAPNKDSDRCQWSILEIATMMIGLIMVLSLVSFITVAYFKPESTGFRRLKSEAGSSTLRSGPKESTATNIGMDKLGYERVENANEPSEDT